MNITIISVGKIKEKYLVEGIKEYSKRLSRYCSLKIEEVPDLKIPGTLNSAITEKILSDEGNKIEKILKSVSSTGTYIISLDVKGIRYNSEKLASEISSLMISGISHIIFIIGGSLGIDKNILEASNLRLSISDMTFTHQMVRFILLEQIYRVFKILHNETYHK